MMHFIPRLLIRLFAIFTLSAQASEFEWSDLGLRFGVDAENRANVNSYELIATFSSPWSWTVNEQWTIDLGFELGLGALDGEGKTGALAHVGPVVEFAFGEIPLSFVVSSGPALLSEYRFNNFDLGGSFQFMTAIGFDYALAESWTLGYRYLHLSNAGLHHLNPGMDLHAISFFRKF